MKTSTLEITIIEPQDGYYLTQAKRNAEDAPILSKKVILSKADSPENWKEISEIKGDEMLAKFNAEQEKRMQAEMNNATR
jgi:hypothetical protein